MLSPIRRAGVVTTTSYTKPKSVKTLQSYKFYIISTSIATINIFIFRTINDKL